MAEDQLRASMIAHLQQVHAAERAQLGELRALRDEVGVPAVAALLDQHLSATREHGDRIAERLAELDAASSILLVTQAIGGSIPKLLVDRLRPGSATACLRDAFVAEAGEVVAYQLLELEALRAGDESTALIAREIREDELRTRDQLATFWHQAVDHVLQAREPRGGHPARAFLVDHLRDVHSIERNAATMLATVVATLADDTACARVEDHRELTVRHGDDVLNRLVELGAGPSLRRRAQGIAVALVKAPRNLLRSERAARDLRDMYVVEHLELAAYLQLEAIAEAAGDDRTLQLATEHIQGEQHMVDWLERDAAQLLRESLRETSPLGPA